MVTLTTDQIKEVELGILVELDRICADHGLRYFLAYGSLLGAVRHNGFIPWDDDIDINMTRSDYEKLISHFDEWKSDEKYGLAFYRDDIHTFPYVKVVDTSTEVIETYVREDLRVGLWVDIFPLEETPVDVHKASKAYSRLALMRNLAIGDPHQGTTPFIRLVKRVAAPFSSRLNPIELARKMDSIACGGPKNERDRYWDVHASGGLTRTLEKALFEPIPHAFEGHEFVIPAGYEKLLTMFYGDWQTPLPPEERLSHSTAVYWVGDHGKE